MYFPAFSGLFEAMFVQPLARSCFAGAALHNAPHVGQMVGHSSGSCLSNWGAAKGFKDGSYSWILLILMDITTYSI